MTAQLKFLGTSGLRQDIILAGLYMEKSSERQYLTGENMPTRIIKAFNNVDFKTASKPFKGNKAVPQLQTMDLDNLLSKQDEKDNTTNQFNNLDFW